MILSSINKKEAILKFLDMQILKFFSKIVVLKYKKRKDLNTTFIINF